MSRRTIDLYLGTDPYYTVTVRAYALPHQLTDSQQRRVFSRLRSEPTHAYGPLDRRLSITWEPDIYGDPRLTLGYAR